MECMAYEVYQALIEAYALDDEVLHDVMEYLYETTASEELKQYILDYKKENEVGTRK